MRKKLLLVDDELVFLQMVKRFFDLRYDLEIDFAGSKKEALRLIEEKKPDMITLEIWLDTDFEIIKKTKQVSPHTKIVVISTISDPDIIKQAHELGALAYLQKPISVASFKDLVFDYLVKNEIESGKYE